MYEISNIFIYRNPSSPDKVIVSFRAYDYNNRKVRNKTFQLPEDKADIIFNKSWEMIRNDGWRCTPYLFQHGGSGYTLSRDYEPNNAKKNRHSQNG